MNESELLIAVLVLLCLICIAGLGWWIEIGSARRDMMRAHAEATRYMLEKYGPPPPGWRPPTQHDLSDSIRRFKP